MIKTNWIPQPAIEPKLATSQMRARRIIAYIQTLTYAPTTAQIIEKLAISRGQFHNAKTYLSGYQRVNLQWYALHKVEEAKAHHKKQSEYLIIGYNKTAYQNRLNKECGVAA